MIEHMSVLEPILTAAEPAAGVTSVDYTPAFIGLGGVIIGGII